MNDETTKPSPEEMQAVVRMPARFWTLVDFKVISLDEAQTEWKKQEAAGVKFDTN